MDRIEQAKDKLLKDRAELFAQAQDLGQILAELSRKVSNAELERQEVEAHYTRLQTKVREIDLQIKFCEGFLSEK